MFIGEYDYDLDMQVKAEEAREEGAHDKAVEAAKNLLKMNILSVEQIAQVQGLSLEEVEALKSELHNS